MYKIFAITITLFYGIISWGQVSKMQGISDVPQIIKFDDPSIKDHQVQLIHLDQHPVPAGEYGNLKKELDIARAQKEATLQNINESNKDKKKRSAPQPIIYKGLQGNVSSSTPNDNDVAVSNAGIAISAVNSNIRIYDDTGGVMLNKTLTSIFSALGNYSWISDPRLLYDPKTDRFILVCFSGAISYESTILVAFSQTNDPTQNWNVYKLNGNMFNDSTWSDYPIIAISDKDLFMTFNQVKDNVHWSIGFKQSVIWQIHKEDGYNGVPLQHTLWSNINDANNNPLRNICPAKYQIEPFGNNMYFLTLRNVAATNDTVFLTQITDSYISGNAQININVLKTPVSYGFPPNARQKKAGPNHQYLMTNDARVLAAIYENDYIHYGSNTVNTNYMNAAVYLGTIKNVSTVNPILSADIISSSTREYGYPSMTLVGNTNDHRIFYTFSHCITDSFPGTSAMYKNAAGDYSDILSVKDGISVINILADSIERWGDYTQIQRKYNNTNRAYLSGSWGKSGTNNSWVTILDSPEWPLSINEKDEKTEHVLFPNPIKENRFKIIFDNKDTQKLLFELYSIDGKKVNTLLHNTVKEGKNEFSFSINPLSAGNYIFKVSDSKGASIISELVRVE